ncbi:MULTISPECIES: PP2C family serine/threonine-protein phosphatase [unclassified Lentimonas]|uniref:PP2C family protein-serine/threonine phosphatase n=1 Tax=unclassified Lentimonas TaxID=2630993 RepID=UPI00132976E7|nr:MULTISPECIES: protein phosphatase 2C domain-containing protein [unclassified Lentimonas]CAA6679072.1 Protein serine/threonine phosphatase PrpC, regulation of stationary phase [Lentimonas sp. CC4]CAA6684188.1 Protein serine/threonine phosphatase PrpC, regulation of stationary phase [Lentimonas sp. CC6]CAA6693714.1 Protein serine/threonine phosphatase PrpC, regulation of stationary phase [Lentimonas sp. CC10]CAA6696353.1 Protein serine/threonine phosphatase PrpC, regulation of stationary phase
MEEQPSFSGQSVRWFGQTDVGRFRKNNQDSFLLLAVDGEGVKRLGKYGEADLTANDFVFAVSDGMGGANAGDFASRIAIDKITRLFPKSFRSAASGIEIGFQDVLSELFDQIHGELTHMGFCYEELRGMGATLSLCWVRPGWLYFAHVGDSRIYHLPKDGGINQVSHDHTHVGWMYRDGQLNETAARSHAGRNALQQVLGGKNQNLSPQFGAIGYEPGDRFLICSDGLVEGLFNRGMERIIRNPAPHLKGTPAEMLVTEAVQTDGKDNTTAVVFEMV